MSSFATRSDEEDEDCSEEQAAAAAFEPARNSSSSSSSSSSTHSVSFQASAGSAEDMSGSSKSAGAVRISARRATPYVARRKSLVSEVHVFSYSARQICASFVNQ